MMIVHTAMHVTNDMHGVSLVMQRQHANCPVITQSAEAANLGSLFTDVVEDTSDNSFQAFLHVAPRMQLQLALGILLDVALHLVIACAHCLLLLGDQAGSRRDVVNANGEASVANEASAELGQPVHAAGCHQRGVVCVQNLHVPPTLSCCTSLSGCAGSTVLKQSVDVDTLALLWCS